ncbi:hypothetical protein GFL21_14575 [Rhizobium anhuiense]|uniref:hypothetical protein n=1 Tax=Rhizobium anhuiense TaxID=1184720 RepID=UPI0014428ABC|nr:hypothetical protein [Rhizobium anhuiense]NKM55745.1 hypothetical protein [Rhizobium anhuiense]
MFDLVENAHSKPLVPLNENMLKHGIPARYIQAERELFLPVSIDDGKAKSGAGAADRRLQMDLAVNRIENGALLAGSATA